MKIYTKTGDRGETSLLGGGRVPKSHARVAAYGDVDELNAALGVTRATLGDGPLGALLQEIQKDLFAIGAQLADPKAAVARRRAKAVFQRDRVERLEQAIDRHEAELPPLQAFLLPGGSPAGAQLSTARAVCQRAERAVVALARRSRVDPLILVYLNRLSDLLFVLARHVNLRHGIPEERW